jgi:hypothetical protein
MPPVASPTEAPSCLAVMRRAVRPRKRTLRLYSVDLRSMGGNHPFGRETFSRREEAERFIEELGREDSELGSALRIEEHELEAGEDN